MRGLVSDSYIHEYFLKIFPHNMSEVTSQSKGLIRVMENCQRIAHAATLVVLEASSKKGNSL